MIALARETWYPFHGCENAMVVLATIVKLFRLAANTPCQVRTKLSLQLLHPELTKATCGERLT